MNRATYPMPDCNIEQIRAVIAKAMGQTSLREEIERFGAAVDGGKMLRGRLVLEVGRAAGTTETQLEQLAAAVELLHAASLMHDDIVDGGTERRHRDAMWISEGTKAAVLIGDLMLSVALGLVQAGNAARIPMLTHALAEMCDAEAEQEYRTELADHPHNVWSLHGLKTALEAQGKTDAAVDTDFEESTARMDVWITSSIL